MPMPARLDAPFAILPDTNYSLDELAARAIVPLISACATFVPFEGSPHVDHSPV